MPSTARDINPFCQFKDIYPEGVSNKKGFKDLPEDLVYGQALAFNCECRAYGRLQETGREDMAVRAHGYVLLTPKQKAGLLERHTMDFEPYNADEIPEAHRIPAIVKDYVGSDVPFVPSMIPKMMRHVKEFHKIGILLHDVKSMNYLNGLFCDFSYSWTAPHFMMDKHDPRARLSVDADDAYSDFVYFDAMIDEWNEDYPRKHIWHRFLRNVDYKRERLRHKGWDSPPPLRWIPADYDWQAAKEARMAQQGSPKGATKTKSRARSTPAKRATSAQSDKAAKSKPKRPIRVNRVQKSHKTKRRTSKSA